jgi:hypothetical protein
MESYPRPADELARLNAYAGVLRNYCAAGDPICAGGDNVTQHLNYFDLYTDSAASWVVSKVDAAADLCAASSSSVASSTVASSTSVATSIAASSSSVATSSAASVSSVAASSAASVSSAAASTIATPIGTPRDVASTPSASASASTIGAGAGYSVAPPMNTTTTTTATVSFTTPAPFHWANSSGIAHPTGYPTTIRTVVSLTSTIRLPAPAESTIVHGSYAEGASHSQAPKATDAPAYHGAKGEGYASGHEGHEQGHEQHGNNGYKAHEQQGNGYKAHEQQGNGYKAHAQGNNANEGYKVSSAPAYPVASAPAAAAACEVVVTTVYV